MQDAYQGTEEERKRPRISISWKLFAYLLLFTTFILIVVWVFQIGLLNYFYRQSKYNELKNADRVLVNTIQYDMEHLQDCVDTLADEYSVSIRIFSLSWDGNHGYATDLSSSADLTLGSPINGIDEAYLTYLYNKAVSNDGLYTLLVEPDKEGLTGDGTTQVPNTKPGNQRWQKLFFSKNMLQVRLVKTEDANGVSQTYLILLNSELMPLNATVQTLKTQFWVIAAILLCGAVVLALLISRNISSPIQKMSRAAGQLAKGHYDADFRVNGYREVMELSDALTHAAGELSKNDALQKELLANISHDLRTPLTMIVGYSEVMRDIPGENTPENVQVIIDETERLSNLVNDLLDLSKLQAGTRQPKMERFGLTETVESVMSRYEKLTQKDGYRIAFSYDTRVDVIADRTMILQVIYNLINNAVNYTGEDKMVRVTQRVLTGGEQLRVRISVTDDGEGIPPDQIPLIWDRYYKVDKVHRRAMIGTGLGLSIVKQILEQHHTTYGVESKLGQGSTFWFELPVAERGDDGDNGQNSRQG